MGLLFWQTTLIFCAGYYRMRRVVAEDTAWQVVVAIVAHNAEGNAFMNH